MDNKKMIEEVLEINGEIEKIFKDITHGLPYKLFRKRIVKELVNKDYFNKLDNLLGQMSNSDLLIVMNIADYVIKIIYVPKYLSQAFFDFEKIKNDPDYLVEAYKETIKQHEAIASLARDKDYYEIIKNKSKVEQMEKYLLETMTNEQIQELANSSKDWQEKLYFYRFLKDGKKPCKFKPQKDGKYFVIKVKYLHEKENNEYYYICNDETVKKGDKVVVTSYTGEPFDLKVSKVLETNYYDEKDLPVSKDESQEFFAKTSDLDEFGAKYSFGKLKFYKDGEQIPFYDADLDRQCYLSSLKIANEITDRLSEEQKNYFATIPNFELVPDDFKKEVILKFVAEEPKHIREIEGAEDEISDYILRNVKNPEVYAEIKRITREVIEEIDDNDFYNLLSDTFEEHNTDFINYIKNSFIKGKTNLECDEEQEEWLAKKVFNTLIVELQKINEYIQAKEKNN